MVDDRTLHELVRDLAALKAVVPHLKRHGLTRAPDKHEKEIAAIQKRIDELSTTEEERGNGTVGHDRT